MKMWFWKTRLTMWCTSKDDCSKICRSITLMWDSGQTEGFGVPLWWFDPKLFLNWKCGHLIREYKLDERHELVHIGSNTCKGERQELVHYGRIIYHQDRDGDDRLVSQDVRGWWVTRGISRRAIGITTWGGNRVLCWFNSQVYRSFLFLLVAWWLEIFWVGYMMI